MIALIVILSVILAIAVKSSTAAAPSKTPAIPTNPANPATFQQSPTFYNSGGVVGARQISGTVPPDSVLAKFNQIPAVAKPQAVIVAYNPQTGTMTFVTQYADTVVGVAHDKTVAFGVSVKDGTNQASWTAGVDIDYITVSGLGGSMDVMNNQFPKLITPSTNSPSDTLIPPSQDLSNGPIVLADPTTATAPYPAASANWTPNDPIESGSYNSDNAIVSLV